jgi:hypothetical protein
MLCACIRIGVGQEKDQGRGSPWQATQYYFGLLGNGPDLGWLVRVQRWLNFECFGKLHDLNNVVIIRARSDRILQVRGMYAAFNTNTAACMGAIGWVVVDYIRTKGHFSVVGMCEGVIAGLVGITPCAGYVSCW